MRVSRRAFVAGAAGCALTRGSVAQFAVGGTSAVTRLDLAKIDRGRILAGASTALGRTPAASSDAASDAFLQITLDVPALAAAAQIDAENAAKYEAKASELLRSWFVKKPLRLEISGYEDLLALSALAEVTVSLAFLAVPVELSDAVKGWFRRYLGYLTTDKTAGLARDAQDRHGSSWLLQVAAFAKLCGDDAAMEAVRVRFRHATLRAEINADGFFAHELKTENPLRNSLMNLDLLAGVCVLASTRFESLWDAELQDGPGMRAAVARHVPYMQRRETWPYPADAAHFNELPGRRPVLAFAARAYAQPEYASLFLTLPEVTAADLLRALPIRQPVLWVGSPRRMG
jgi:hypothetical protein